MTNEAYTGPERRKSDNVRHILVKIFVIWLIIFTIFTIFMYHRLSSTVNDLSNTKVNVSELRKTNCGLLAVLKRGRQTRLLAEQHDKGKALINDKAAVQAYSGLIMIFASCDDKGGK